MLVEYLLVPIIINFIIIMLPLSLILYLLCKVNSGFISAVSLAVGFCLLFIYSFDSTRSKMEKLDDFCLNYKITNQIRISPNLIRGNIINQDKINTVYLYFKDDKWFFMQ